MANPLNKGKKTSLTSSQQMKTTPVQQPIKEITSSKSASANSPTHQEISKRAEEIYYQRGCPQGQDEKIWLQAEQELRTKKAATVSSK